MSRHHGPTGNAFMSCGNCGGSYEKLNGRTIKNTLAFTCGGHRRFILPEHEDGYQGAHHPDDIVEDRCPTHHVKLRLGCDVVGDVHRPDGTAHCPVPDCRHETYVGSAR